MDSYMYFIQRITFQGVVEYGVGQVRLVKEGYTPCLTTVQEDGLLNRVLDGQVEGV